MSEKPDKMYPYKPPAKPLVFGQMPEMPWKKGGQNAVQKQETTDVDAHQQASRSEEVGQKIREEDRREPQEKEMTDKDFWLCVRQALLMVVDTIERKLKMPLTSDLRRK